MLKFLSCKLQCCSMRSKLLNRGKNFAATFDYLKLPDPAKKSGSNRSRIPRSGIKRQRKFKAKP
jgi:hypothetical protein